MAYTALHQYIFLKVFQRSLAYQAFFFHLR